MCRRTRDQNGSWLLDAAVGEHELTIGEVAGYRVPAPQRPRICAGETLQHEVILEPLDGS